MQINPEEYFRKYAPLVLRRCRFLLKNESDAADALQDTFVLLLRNQSRLEHASPSSLLYRIATNVCLNRIRDRKGTAEDSDTLLEQIACEGDLESRFAFGSTLARLFQNEPSSSRVIATLFFIDEMTLEQVSRQTGLSVSGVRKRLKKIKIAAQAKELEK